MKYICNNKGDEDKVSQALQKMMAEDVTLKTVNDSENRQTLLYGMGDQHLEITASKLATRYKCEIKLETPKVAFRETIKKKSDVDSKYKKQSGGHGQYEEEVVGGAVPKNYFPAVEKGLQEAVVKGPLAGYPVVGVKAVLYDGSYHPVDSSEMAFKTATIQAFKKGFMEASCFWWKTGDRGRYSDDRTLWLLYSASLYDRWKRSIFLRIQPLRAGTVRCAGSRDQ